MRASLRDRLVTGRNDYETAAEDSSYARMMFGSPDPAQTGEHGEARQGSGSGAAGGRSALDGEE